VKLAFTPGYGDVNATFMHSSAVAAAPFIGKPIVD